MILTKKCVVLGLLSVLGHVARGMTDTIEVDPEYATFDTKDAEFNHKCKGEIEGLTTVEFLVTNSEGKVTFANTKIGVFTEFPIRELGLHEEKDAIHILRQNAVVATIPDLAWKDDKLTAKHLFRDYFTLHRAVTASFSFGSVCINGYELIVAFMKRGNVTDVMFHMKGENRKTKYRTYIPITKLMIEAIDGSDALRIFQIQTDKKQEATMEDEKSTTTECKSNIFSSNGEILEFTDYMRKRGIKREFMKHFNDLKHHAVSAGKAAERKERTRAAITKAFTDANVRGNHVPQTKLGNLITSMLPLADEELPEKPKSVHTTEEKVDDNCYAGGNPLSGAPTPFERFSASIPKLSPKQPVSHAAREMSEEKVPETEPTKPVVSEEEWPCSVCTFNNNPRQLQCGMCMTPRPQCEVVNGKVLAPSRKKVQEGPKWNCTMCTFLNSGKQTSCEICGTLKTPKLARGGRNSESPLAEVRPETWACNNCKAMNISDFPARCYADTHCMKCKAPRPDTAKMPTMNQNEYFSKASWE